MLYLFSGLPRKGSVAYWLRKLAKRHEIQLEMSCVDIRVRPHYDLTKSSIRHRFLQSITTGRHFAVIASPPCSTFSRACWTNRLGPRPSRSFVHPRGLPRITWAERRKTDWGNTMADLTFAAIREQLGHQHHMAFFENPEDLGAMTKGEHQGKRPASMWQFPACAELLKDERTRTVAFHQLDFGTPYLKPTRFLLLNVPHSTDLVIAEDVLLLTKH